MAVTTRTLERVDYLLEYLESSLSDLEENGTLWAQLTEEQKDDFLQEWPIVEDKIADLQRLVDGYPMPADRRRRYTRLRERVATDRLLLEDLRERA